MTCGIHYKLAILNSPKINTLWENCHQFLLAYQNFTKPTDLERGDPRIPQVVFLDSEVLKYQSCIRWNFSQLNSLKIRVFKESEVMKLQLSRLEKEMESMKEEFRKELDALKYDIHSIKEEILNEIRVCHTHKSLTQEEVNKNKDVESQSLTGKVEAQLKIKKFYFLTYDLSSTQDPHFQGLNSTPWNYFILNIDMIKFD